ncbi:hypothetical protein NL676_030451 [Syzygium grande]|nr:hypothetical protein NL676_030451 [Syzygium grande]
MALNVAAAKLMKPKNQPSRAYVTFLAGNGDYVKGVVGLAKGMRKVKSKYPLVVAVLPDVPQEHRKILVDQGCIDLGVLGVQQDDLFGRRHPSLRQH